MRHSQLHPLARVARLAFLVALLGPAEDALAQGPFLLLEDFRLIEARGISCSGFGCFDEADSATPASPFSPFDEEVEAGFRGVARQRSFVSSFEFVGDGSTSGKRSAFSSAYGGGNSTYGVLFDLADTTDVELSSELFVYGDRSVPGNSAQVSIQVVEVPESGLPILLELWGHTDGFRTIDWQTSLPPGRYGLQVDARASGMGASWGFTFTGRVPLSVPTLSPLGLVLLGALLLAAGVSLPKT